MSVFDDRLKMGLIENAKCLKSSVSTSLKNHLSSDLSNGEVEDQSVDYRYFVPRYRIPTVPTYNSSDRDECFDKAYSDVEDAFKVYLSNIPDEYKFTVLVGFGTGAVLCDRLADAFGTDKHIIACMCVGIGTGGTEPRTFESANFACISNVQDNVDTNPFLLSESFSHEESVPVETPLSSKLFDITTGRVFDEVSDPAEYLDTGVITGIAQNFGNEGSNVLVFKIHITDDRLLGMISKSSGYVGKGIYHLFDYQILYQTIVQMMCNIGLKVIA